MQAARPPRFPYRNRNKTNPVRPHKAPHHLIRKRATFRPPHAVAQTCPKAPLGPRPIAGLDTLPWVDHTARDPNQPVSRDPLAARQAATASPAHGLRREVHMEVQQLGRPPAATRRRSEGKNTCKHPFGVRERAGEPRRADSEDAAFAGDTMCAGSAAKQPFLVFPHACHNQNTSRRWRGTRCTRGWLAEAEFPSRSLNRHTLLPRRQTQGQANPYPSLNVPMKRLKKL